MSVRNRDDSPSWRPPEPVETSGPLYRVLVRASLIATGALSFFVWLSPSLLRGATRSDRLKLEDRGAEIENVVASTSEHEQAPR